MKKTKGYDLFLLCYCFVLIVKTRNVAIKVSLRFGYSECVTCVCPNYF